MFQTAYGPQEIEPDKISSFFAVRAPDAPPEISLLVPLEPTLRELLEIDRRMYAGSPTRSFGLEARVCHFLTAGSAIPPEINPRQLLIRPAPEPIIYSYWERFTDWSLDDDSVAALASCLCGRDLGYRTSTCATLPGKRGLSALYPEASIATRWLSSLPLPPQGSDVLDGLSAAFYAFASAVLHHPLVDGNGRFGRALFQGVLARTLGLSSPMLALGPLTYVNKPAISQGWTRLGAEGDWSELVDAYHAVLGGCLSYHREVADLL